MVSDKFDKTLQNIVHLVATGKVDLPEVKVHTVNVLVYCIKNWPPDNFLVKSNEYWPPNKLMCMYLHNVSKIGHPTISL